MAEVEVNDKKSYELTLIISSDLSEFDAEKAAEKIQASIAAKGGELTGTSNWGKKKLAYIIKGNEFGFYYTLVFDIDPEAIATLTRELELAPEVLRHIVISLEKEGVTADQLFTPEKEEQMIAASVKEKMAPVAEVKPMVKPIPAVVKETPVATEPGSAPEETPTRKAEPISKEELDQKIEEALKSDLE
ncbi:30S ribosomal protein S6 [candidate division Kazan bacterium RIFCSPHIGHO2_01_FULL_49_10]|uniref:Small ribosomal subunit protein bS6 n=1 Tax=candidate division Kazan bacterium RIFCSPLOWO2_01_FULL_48_13 TaxID=1798539 RepID=A0A1F4PP75_UNCK3|nr:MAG: 30S ribosomal protein S6 [candidate division Kazan bacterium RIFCSPHIGHO2_01_FULL_49_10]OGB85429.1 MAG: 30S ribosomal protein S6 [candidate division Kazan bacterium RIFCSPLOWO2_01_FULL_48_13]